MLAYLLAQPVTRAEVLLGTFAGLAAALTACLCLGLGACAGVLAWKGVATNPEGFFWLAGLAVALTLSMLSVGVLISVLARRTSVAVGTSVFVWLALVFATDLGLMAGAVALRLRIETLFAVSAASPLQVFKMWSLHAVDGTLDVLGPAGLYAAEEFRGSLHGLFAASMAAWIVLPLAAALLIFRRTSPV
jgi:Cu-processing system permease protein